MGAKTKIEWCDATWNPITGCTPCSPGCEHCYAANMVRRFPHLHGYYDDPAPTGQGDQVEFHGVANPTPFATVQFHPERLGAPLHWRRPRRVFVCSMGDLFHEDVTGEWRRRVALVMANCPQHTFLMLTKRPQYVGAFNRATEYVGGVEPNWWLGVTVCNQAEANEKIPVLLQTPAALRFVSIEPMLGPVNLGGMIGQGAHCPHCGDIDLVDEDGCCRTCGRDAIWYGVDWVICGGETGAGARPMHPRWVRSLRDQCEAAGVPFFFKGWGDWAPFATTAVPGVTGGDCGGPGSYSRGDFKHHDGGSWLLQWEDGSQSRAVRQYVGTSSAFSGEVFRVGKKRSGALLDGREWHQFPEAR